MSILFFLQYICKKGNSIQEQRKVSKFKFMKKNTFSTKYISKTKSDVIMRFFADFHEKYFFFLKKNLPFFQMYVFFSFWCGWYDHATEKGPTKANRKRKIKSMEGSEWRIELKSIYIYMCVSVSFALDSKQQQAQLSLNISGYLISNVRLYAFGSGRHWLPLRLQPPSPLWPSFPPLSLSHTHIFLLCYQAATVLAVGQSWGG